MEQEPHSAELGYFHNNTNEIQEKNVEHVSPETSATLESNRLFGEKYRGLVDVALGKNESSFDPGSELVIRMQESLKRHQERQALQMQLGQIGARQLLSQAFQSKNEQQLLTDDSQYRLAKGADGIPIVIVKAELAQQLRPGSQALAIKPRDGVSFVMVREFADEVQTALGHEENIPHEVHHVLWDFLRKDGVITMTEPDPDMADAFRMYQDEVIARAVSDGALSGYSHLTMRPNERERLKAEAPEKVDIINETVARFNDLLADIDDVRKSRGLPKTDMIASLVSSKNFDELEYNLNTLKELFAQQPEITPTPYTETEVEDGWGAV